MNCLRCNEKLIPQSKYCINCGFYHSYRWNTIKCNNCNSEILDKYIYCDICKYENKSNQTWVKEFILESERYSFSGINIEFIKNNTKAFMPILSDKGLEDVLKIFSDYSLEHKELKDRISGDIKENKDILISKLLFNELKIFVLNNFGLFIKESCPIRLLKGYNFKKDFVSAFNYEISTKECYIEINDKYLQNKDYLIRILTYQYLNYIFFSLSSNSNFNIIPIIFRYGFIDYISHKFYLYSSFIIDSEYKKSWNEYFYFGKTIIQQIINEGYPEKLFFNSYLDNINQKNFWNKLDI